MTTQPRAWTPEEDRYLREHYFSQTRKDIALALGRTDGSLRKRCSVLGLNQKHRYFTDEEREQIKAFYAERDGVTLDDFALEAFAQQLGRTKSSICKVAGELGLTTQGRPVGKRIRQAIGSSARQRLASQGHPRGMAGKQHDAKSRQKMRDAQRRIQNERTPLDVLIRTTKALQTKMERYGTGNPAMRGQNAYSRTKSGKRADLDNRFFRSSWEANYARYLNFLMAQGEIAAWEYEPQTFVFHGVTRGQLTYTPDFKVLYRDGSYEWHEVKGWMDAKSKAKLKRMAKFYPDETLIVIGEDEYRAIRKWAALIPNWEHGVRPTAW